MVNRFTPQRRMLSKGRSSSENARFENSPSSGGVMPTRRASSGLAKELSAVVSYLQGLIKQGDMPISAIKASSVGSKGLLWATSYA